MGGHKSKTRSDLAALARDLPRGSPTSLAILLDTIAFSTPLISTILLLAVTGQRLTLTLGPSAALILLASVFGSRVNNKNHDIWRV